MLNTHEELQRRIEQFASYLRPMDRRAHEIAHGPCFTIFEERRPRGASDAALVESRELALQGVEAAWGELAIGEEVDSTTLGLSGNGLSGDGLSGGGGEWPEVGWRGNDSSNRFVQFCFQEKWFCIDLPRQTLFRAEAEEMLRYRNGFFYLTDRKQFTLYREDVEGFDPFRKVYIYGDEHSAAEDMAFLFFQVWKFPVDARLYVTSAAFAGKHRWEQGVPIE